MLKCPMLKAEDSRQAQGGIPLRRHQAHNGAPKAHDRRGGQDPNGPRRDMDALDELQGLPDRPGGQFARGFPTIT